MANQISLDSDGIVRQVLSAGMDAKMLAADLPKILELKKQLAEQGKPLLVLIDTTAVHQAGSATRNQGIKNLGAMGYRRIAIIGATTYIRHVINFVLLASGNSKKIKSFKNEHEAKAWLYEAQDG